MIYGSITMIYVMTYVIYLNFSASTTLTIKLLYIVNVIIKWNNTY